MTFVMKVPIGSAIDGPDERLGGHVQDEIERTSVQCSSQSGRITDVCYDAVDQLLDTQPGRRGSALDRAAARGPSPCAPSLVSHIAAHPPLNPV